MNIYIGFWAPETNMYSIWVLWPLGGLQECENDFFEVGRGGWRFPIGFKKGLYGATQGLQPLALSFLTKLIGGALVSSIFHIWCPKLGVEFFPLGQEDGCAQLDRMDLEK